MAGLNLKQRLLNPRASAEALIVELKASCDDCRGGLADAPESESVDVLWVRCCETHAPDVRAIIDPVYHAYVRNQISELERKKAQIEEACTLLLRLEVGQLKLEDGEITLQQFLDGKQKVKERLGVYWEASFAEMHAQRERVTIRQEYWAKRA